MSLFFCVGWVETEIFKALKALSVYFMWAIKHHCEMTQTFTAEHVHNQNTSPKKNRSYLNTYDLYKWFLRIGISKSYCLFFFFLIVTHAFHATATILWRTALIWFS